MPDWIRFDAVTVTPAAAAAAAALADAGLAAERLLSRFGAGDWGAQDEYGRSLCDFCVARGLPVISWYTAGNGTEVAVLASADRSETLVCLRSEHGPREVSAEEGYAAWSRWYDAELNQLIVLEQPIVDRLLEGIPRARVLDAAAGTGRHALKLAREGSHVVAFDTSLPMLAVGRARARAEQLPVSFLNASLAYPLPIRSDRFDLVLCALAFCHLSDLDGPCRELFRVARPGARFLLTDFHPDAIESGWHTDTWSGLTVYRLPTYAHRRSGYLDAVERAGFSIRSVIDVPISEIPAEASHMGLVKRWGAMNFCLVIEAEKPGHARRPPSGS